MVIVFLSKEIAIVQVDQPVAVGTIYSFPVLLPSLPSRVGDSFGVHGEITACIPVKEHPDDVIQYKLRIEQLAGASEQDEMIFNAYLAFRQTEQELSIIREQNIELGARIEAAIQTTVQQFQTFGTHLSVLNDSLTKAAQTLKQKSLEEQLLREAQKATIH